MIIPGLLIFVFAGCDSSRKSASVDMNEVRFNTRLPDSISKKQSGGVDYIAEGNIPAKWKLELDHDKSFTFISNDGNQLTVLPVRPDSLPDHVTYNSGEMKINMYNDACKESKNARIEVTVKGKTYTGCGSYIYDYRVSDNWVLEQINGTAVSASSFSKGLPLFNINLSNKTLTGHDGCNNISSAVEVLGSKMRFSAITSTRMACKNDLFSTLLARQFSEKIVDYFIRDGKLVFYLGDDSMIRFRRAG